MRKGDGFISSWDSKDVINDLDCQRAASQDLDPSMHADDVDIVITPVIGPCE